MQAKIFYFSGTGNSLIAASYLACGLDGVPVNLVRHKNQKAVQPKDIMAQNI
jgi:hypothetical protein